MIYLIRHGESVANAGERVEDHKTAPLSEKGFEQARVFATGFNEKPDLIVYSPFLRAEQTAQPFIDKFSDVPVEVWDVQEFTFLSDDRYRGTTVVERRILSKEYYSRNDLDYACGKGAESFNQMLKRVHGIMEKLQKLDKDKNIVIFTHGRFMRACLMVINNLPISIESFLSLKPIDNLEVVKFEL